jgi:hypothetical protein
LRPREGHSLSEKVISFEKWDQAQNTESWGVLHNHYLNPVLTFWPDVYCQDNDINCLILSQHLQLSRHTVVCREYNEWEGGHWDDKSGPGARLHSHGCPLSIVVLVGLHLGAL